MKNVSGPALTELLCRRCVEGLPDVGVHGVVAATPGPGAVVQERAVS